MLNHPKKSLGQHFLRSNSALEKIVSAACLTTTDTVLEIGPGQGALTEKILATGARVIAIEKDENLAEYLKTFFKAEIVQRRLKIITGDALLFKVAREPWLKKNYKVVANIPYYITGQFFRLFLEQEKQPKLMVILVQKEVARRIVAADKKESILSISVKVYGQPTYKKTVPAGAFSPAPAVDSAILKIDNISKDFFVDINEKDFFTLLKRGFASKRKQLKNNLNLPEKVFSACGLKPQSRAEDLNLHQWQCLIQKIHSNKN